MSISNTFDNNQKISRNFLPIINPFNLAYGSFGSNLTQTLGANPSLAISYNQTYIANGVSYDVANPTRVVVQANGIYRFTYSIQFDKVGGGVSRADIWIAIDGTTVPNSGGQCVVANTNGETFPFCEYILALNAGQYVEVIFTSSDATMAASAFPAAGVIPAVPAIIANIQQIQ